MYILIFIIGLISGILFNYAINDVSYRINASIKRTVNTLPVIITILCFEILFFRYGFTAVFAKASVMTSILVIISFIDFRHSIIPDFMSITALVTGIIFIFILRTSFADAFLGMLCGGIIMLLLALLPGGMGGGDVKLMFALGAFLGLTGTMWALILAFAASSVVSIILIVFKIKKTKDYIPFGPFLSLGSFISLLLYTK